MRDILWFGLYTGMRLNDVLPLRWERVGRAERVSRADETETPTRTRLAWGLHSTTAAVLPTFAGSVRRRRSRVL